MSTPLTTLRFALPPSVGEKAASQRAGALQSYLSAALGLPVEVVVPPSYEALAKDLLGGRVEAAWAPPFVCARIEAMGIRVLVRGVRSGSASYRAALVSKKGAHLKPEQLFGKKALWADRDSVGGYLLPLAFLKAKGLDPNKLFSHQGFAGSYRAALEGVLGGFADVTSVFARGNEAIGLHEILPEKQDAFEVIAFTEESPNDGVAVSMSTPVQVVEQLERTLLKLHDTPEGAAILKDIFRAERFDAAPRMGYRALYRVALASL